MGCGDRSEVSVEKGRVEAESEEMGVTERTSEVEMAEGRAGRVRDYPSTKCEISAN